MQISNINNYSSNYKNCPIFFYGAKNKEPDELPINQNLSFKSLRLMKALDIHIENIWSDIKNGKIISENPQLTYINGDSFITIKPVYSQKCPAILFEKYDGKICERIIFERRNPNNFRYEKTTETDYGSATLKSYNSRTENKPKINNIADNLILETLPQILPTKTLLEVFPKYCYTRTNKGQIKLN